MRFSEISGVLMIGSSLADRRTELPLRPSWNKSDITPLDHLTRAGPDASYHPLYLGDPSTMMSWIAARDSRLSISPRFSTLIRSGVVMRTLPR